MDKNSNELLLGMTWPKIKTDFVMDSTIENFANAVLLAGGKSHLINAIKHKAKTQMNWGAKEPVAKKYKRLTNR